MPVIDIYTLVGLSSLIVQVAILALIIYGYSLKLKYKFRSHGAVMASATILHLVLIFGIMVPSFIYAVLPDYIIASPFTLTSIVGLLHGITGIVTTALALWLVGAWRFKINFQSCFSRKKFMLVTFAVWIVTLVLGITLFAIFYGPALLS